VTIMIRTETARLISDNLAKLDDEQRALIRNSLDANGRLAAEVTDSDAIGPIVAELDVFTRPDVLSWTVLQTREGLEYVVTPEAARCLASGDELVHVEVLGGKTVVATKASIEWSLRYGKTFDQLTRGGQKGAA
jgi:hypothetical protein